MTRISSLVLQKRKKARDRLIEAAEALIRKHGLDGLTIDDVTADAGIGKGTFYLHFESRDALLAELMRLHNASTVGRITQLMQSLDDPAEAIAVGYRHAARCVSADALQMAYLFAHGSSYERSLEANGPYLERRVMELRDQGYPIARPAAVAEMIVAGFTSIMHRIHNGTTLIEEVDGEIALLLRLFGLSASEAAAIIARPLPPLPESETFLKSK